MGLYERKYTHPINWEDLPSRNTALDAERLNKMNDAIVEIDAAFKDAVDQIVEIIKEGQR